MDKYKNCTPQIIFSKQKNKKTKIPNTRFRIIYILVKISFFGRVLHCVLSSAFLKFFVVGQPWWPIFLLSISTRYLLIISQNFYSIFLSTENSFLRSLNVFCANTPNSSFVSMHMYTFSSEGNCFQTG